MKCRILFSVKNKKDSINLLSAELAQRVVKVKTCVFFSKTHCSWSFYFVLQIKRKMVT